MKPLIFVQPESCEFIVFEAFADVDMWMHDSFLDVSIPVAIRTAMSQRQKKAGLRRQKAIARSRRKSDLAIKVP